MRTDELLYLTPLWAIAAALLAICVAAVEVGFRVGRARKLAGVDDEPLTSVEGGLLGLLALLIAFTYSMAISRYEARRQLVLDEANAIGTASLRAGFEASPEGAHVAALLREYVDVRLEFSEAGIDARGIDAALAETDRLLGEIWAATTKIVGSRPPTPVTALVVASVNEVIDVNGKRLSAARDHVPEAAIFLLMAVAIAAVGLVGHCTGSKGRRSLWTSFTLPTIIVAVLALTLDLDRPWRGLVTVSQQPLLDLQQSLKAH